MKEMNPVKVSPRKNGELLSNIARIKHPVRQRKDKYDDFLQELKLSEHPKPRLQLPVEPVVQEKKRVDYLAEMREKHSQVKEQSDWVEKLKRKELSQRDKIEIVKIKSEAMEQRAQFYEAINNQEANQLYLDSIKAKMALIEHL